MPPTDYIATPGGSLKLKGAPTKITKHKKHKRPQQQQQQQRRLDEPPPRKDSSPNAPTDASAEAVLAQPIERKGSDGEEPPRDSAQQQQQQPEAEEQRGEAVPSTAYGAGRTQAERRHDERRRKRLDERLKREGVKTHKERVEELNRYLSNLSEHHDMPRIGPG